VEEKHVLGYYIHSLCLQTLIIFFNTTWILAAKDSQRWGLVVLQQSTAASTAAISGLSSLLRRIPIVMNMNAMLVVIAMIPVRWIPVYHVKRRNLIMHIEGIDDPEKVPMKVVGL